MALPMRVSLSNVTFVPALFSKSSTSSGVALWNRPEGLLDVTWASADKMQIFLTGEPSKISSEEVEGCTTTSSAQFTVSVMGSLLQAGFSDKEHVQAKKKKYFINVVLIDVPLGSSVTYVAENQYS